MIDLSTDQAKAASMIESWLTNYSSEDPIFRLFGYAGTGKTTTINNMIEKLDLKGQVRFAAYTGKAAMVMRKHKLPAQTIHSLIYQPVEPDSARCNDLQKKLKSETDPDKKKILRAELKDASKVSFVVKEQSDLDGMELLVLDECSMVNDTMLRDLLSFGVPMLVLGDPGQLPPIEGEGALTRVKPNILLTEIHRQAQGNPIIDFATRARNNIHIPRIRLGGSAHIASSQLSPSQVLSFSQILCGKNNTRQTINRRVRQIKEHNDIYPVVGEKLICLRNNAAKGLYNGLICEVVEVGHLLDTSIQLKIKRETDLPGDEPLEVNALRAHFEAYQDKDALDGVKWWDRADADEFDFGYAITVHKSQGSQWENVLMWDDGMYKGWQKQDRPRWMYTGITRAMENITIAS